MTPRVLMIVAILRSRRPAGLNGIAGQGIRGDNGWNSALVRAWLRR